MRVLQVITPSKIAGAERSTTSLCEHLVRAGHTVEVACKAGSPLAEVMRGVGLTVHEPRISGKLNVAAAFRLARLARAMDAEVIHTNLSTAAVWGSVAGRIAGIPVVAHVRALNTKTCYLAADRVIAISEAVKRHLVDQGMSGDRIDVVYTGLDTERYGIPLPKEEAKQRLGIPADRPTLGVVAHLSAKKGHATFLEAVARVAATHPEITCLFLGDGDLRQPLAEQARAMGFEVILTHDERRSETARRRDGETAMRTDPTDPSDPSGPSPAQSPEPRAQSPHPTLAFLGFQPDVRPFYAAMDIVVLPSIDGEGLPRTLLEASFLGIPVIGTRLSGVPEIIAEGETGFIVPRGDAEAMADRLRRLIGDAELRARFGAAGTARIRERFSVAQMVAGTVAVYERARRQRTPG